MATQSCIIGLGNRARNGKDTAAKFITENFNRAHIFHWADALKDEVNNKSKNNIDEFGNRINPLITFDGKYYNLLNEINTDKSVTRLQFHPDEVPNLHKIFTSRNISKYWGDDIVYTDNKDSLMLQFWGTDFRRNYINMNYWVNKTISNIQNIIKTDTVNSPILFLIPDTRFINEFHAIKSYNIASCYISVIRYDENGNKYYDPSRDKNHQSECELDDIKPDYLIEAKSGDITSIQYQMSKIYSDILNKLSIYKNLTKV